MTGVSRKTFDSMVDVVKADEKKKKKSGRRPKLIIEDQVLMVIQYWREYRTYYHIGLDWGLSESAVCRTVYKIENILISSKKFSLPGLVKFISPLIAAKCGLFWLQLLLKFQSFLHCYILQLQSMDSIRFPHIILR